MKVYVVTSGNYSEYHIEAVYTDPDMAKAYASLDSGRWIEEYDADTIRVAKKPLYACIRYSPNLNRIDYISTDFWRTPGTYPDPDRYEDRNGEFVFWCILSDRTKEDIEKNGKQSPLLLKAAQDRYAKYKYAHPQEKNVVEVRVVGPEEGAKAFARFFGVASKEDENNA